MTFDSSQSSAASQHTEAQANTIAVVDQARRHTAGAGTRTVAGWLLLTRGLDERSLGIS
jgi:hypothetical protein